MMREAARHGKESFGAGYPGIVRARATGRFMGARTGQRDEMHTVSCNFGYSL
jgi:hypothetical protein